VAPTRDVLELSNGELCVLRWLRISNGKATLSASAVAKNSLFIVPHRLLQAGYVRVQTDTSSPRTVHYTVTASGLEALEINEGTAFFPELGKRRGTRSSLPKDFSAPKRPLIRDSGPPHSE
jgi:DNA-binding MarR family transcriptional regulator